MNEKFSIIIPVYNSEKYLERCINSVINQTYTNLEVILVNDGSTDNSKEICINFSKKDDRIKVIQKRNGGSSSARNKGIDNATGKYIIFIDSDDWIKENTIEELNKFICKFRPNLLIYGITTPKNNNENIQNDYEIKNGNFSKGIVNLIIEEKINSPCNKIYELRNIKDNNIRFEPNINIGEDLLFNINYIKYVESVYVTNKKYYYYNKEINDSLSTKYNSYKYNELMKVNKKIQDILLEKNDNKLLKTVDFIRIKNIFSCIIDLYHKDCILNKKEKVEFIKRMKNENKIGILNGIGLKPIIFSLIYNIIPIKMLLIISKKVKRNY